ncbi:MAG: HAMP domain-containing histidine kinase [Eubacterium sp.]|jgi:signal transduction histidine kinase|nr:HAMP domain-containing histidine kinase [Eubacterium sp.]
MRKIKIRTKMTLWYTLLTTILLLIFLYALYNVIAASLHKSEQSKLNAIVLLAEYDVESDNGKIEITVEKPIPAGILMAILNEYNDPIYVNSDKDWFFKYDFLPNNFFQVDYNGKDWLIFDKIVEEDDVLLKVRVCSSLEIISETMEQVFSLMLIVIPLFYVITIFGGLFIAKRALNPIAKITGLAKKIGRGDLSLSSRIESVNGADEVGELASTFNEMLNALEKSFEKEKRFSSDASHELRTPVAVIMANSEEMLSSNADEETQASASAILAESKRMNDIISQLLMLARGLEGKYRLQLEEVNISIVAEAVIEQLRPEGKKRAISLKNQTRDIVVNADQSLITQMMLNLISNAIKYGKNNGNVWIQAENACGKCKITISDDGVGIDQNNLKLIFDRFYRVEKSRDRSGSGLGLSIVKWIVDIHKGSIEVESSLNAGTIFTIIL